MPGAVEEAQVGTGERSGDSLDVTERVGTAHEGDDIVVVPHEDDQHPTHNRGVRIAIIALVSGVAIALIAAVIAIAANNNSSSNVSTQHPNDVAPPPAQQPAPSDAVDVRPSTPRVSAPDVSLPIVSPKPTTLPSQSHPGGNVATPPQQQPPQPPQGPKTSPVSALQWTGTNALTMHPGDTQTINISVKNPSDGTVSLPQQLSCPGTWVLKQNDGPVCTENTQQLSPGASASTKLKIEAVDPGTYSFAVGGAYKITVTVN
jgi:hypothetical protein